jgi:hypothetical protein
MALATYDPLATTDLQSSALSEERCIRRAVGERGLSPSPAGLADATAEDEPAPRRADFASPMGIGWPALRG